MMRRLFLQALLVGMLIVLLATPASAGLVTDPLGVTGGQPPLNAPGTAPAPIYPGNPEAAPAQIFPGAVEIAPVQATGDSDGDGFAPRSWGLDGGCDDDQICGGMDDDQLIGWDDEALRPASSQTPPALNVFFGPIADDGYIAEAAPVQATCDADGDGFADNDCDGR